MNHRERKQAIRSFMQNHYTDERLAQLLAHAQAGRLGFTSCCCFVGIPSANHPLADVHDESSWDRHSEHARNTTIGKLAEAAFLELPGSQQYSVLTEDKHNAVRRRILIPMIRAEQKRREARRAEFQETLQEVFA